MVALLTLLTFGSIWFWLVVVLGSIVVVCYLENEQAVAATVITIGSVLALIFLGNTEILSWVAAHPVLLGLYILGYIGVGGLYGILKWYLLLRDRADRYREVLTAWLEKIIKEKPPADTIELFREALATRKLTGDVRKAFRNYVKRDCYGKKILKPSVGHNKGRIISWMTYWPLSGLWTLINDPIRRIFKFVYRRITTLLTNMADKVFAGIDADMEEE